MQKVSFRISPHFDDRIEITIVGGADVYFDSLMDFLREQFPRMCGPIHYVKDGHEMGMLDGDLVPIRYVGYDD